MSGCARLCQDRSSYMSLRHVRPGYVRLCQVISVYDRIDHVTTNYVKVGQDKLG
jgi:hypothetical protein